MKLLRLMLIFCILTGCSVQNEKPDVFYGESVEVVPSTNIFSSVSMLPPATVLSADILSEDGLNSPPSLRVLEGYSAFGFGDSWLYTYNPNDYNLEIYPYTVGSLDLEDMRALWDLDSNGIVDSYDYSLFNEISMTQLLSDMEILKKHPMTTEQLETLVMGIYNMEKDMGIADYKLFKILLWQSGFDVLVSSYTSEDIVARLTWESDTQTGWLDIHWWSYQYWYGPGFKYTYKYEISNK
jgi:hypothetical protein